MYCHRNVDNLFSSFLCSECLLFHAMLILDIFWQMQYFDSIYKLEKKNMDKRKILVFSENGGDARQFSTNQD